MNNQDLLLPPSDGTPSVEKTAEGVETAPDIPDNPPSAKSRLLRRLSPFWHDRLIEASMILSMGLYYITGNDHLGTNSFFHLNPLFSLPFLLIFALLCWYRLAFAVALLPLHFPTIYSQKRWQALMTSAWLRWHLPFASQWPYYNSCYSVVAGSTGCPGENCETAWGRLPFLYSFS